jgi:hypothetical protein
MNCVTASPWKVTRLEEGQKRTHLAGVAAKTTAKDKRKEEMSAGPLSQEGAKSTCAGAHLYRWGDPPSPCTGFQLIKATHLELTKLSVSTALLHVTPLTCGSQITAAQAVLQGLNY